MKKNVFILIAALLIIFAACKKDDDGGVIPGANDPAFNAPYSTKLVSDQKDDVSAASMELVDEIEAMSNLDALAVIMNLVDLMGDEVMPGMQTPIKAAQAIQEKSSPSEISDILKATGDEFSIQDMFDEMAGEHDWNPVSSQFDQTSTGGNEIIFYFPGMPEDVTNNATLTISDVTIFEITAPMEDWPEDAPTEMPASISVSLEYEGDEIMSFEYTASYTSEGMPTALNTVLTIEDYSFSIVITHTPYSVASFKQSLKHLNEVLIEISVTANGNWTIENIENSITYDDDCYYDSYLEEMVCDEYIDDVSVKDIVNNGNAYLQVMDIKIVGYVDVLNLEPVMRTLDDQCWEQEIITEQQWATQSANAINQYSNLVLVYVTGEKIAEVEAYPKYYEEWEEWDIAVRLKFADGSIVDGEVFAEEEMEDFLIAMDELFGFDEEMYY